MVTNDVAASSGGFAVVAKLTALPGRRDELVAAVGRAGILDVQMKFGLKYHQALEEAIDAAER